MLFLLGHYASSRRFCRWVGEVDVTQRLFLNNQVYFRGGEILKGTMWDIQHTGPQDKRCCWIQRQRQNRCLVLYSCIKIILTSLQVWYNKITPNRKIFISTHNYPNSEERGHRSRRVTLQNCCSRWLEKIVSLAHCVLAVEMNWNKWHGMETHLGPVRKNSSSFVIPEEHRLC